ncbi:MAG: Fic family protein [Gammaproteobacteria bacterium]|nr:MAG: Fic family protein [Gammaproteobacteria bacterium]
MKIPLEPTEYQELIKEIDPRRFLELLQLGIGPEPRGKYYHWDELRHRPTPEGLSHREWWLMVKQARITNRQQVPFKDIGGNPFTFTMIENLLKKLHKLDRDAAGTIRADAPIATDTNRDRYLISSLFEEAITSSQLEGASTTTKEAKNMLRSGRKPHDRSERMILNNFNAMMFIRETRGEPLSAEFLLELHKIITLDTLDDPTGSGRWRKKSENITVQDMRDGTILHAPPDADLIPERITNLINFANTDEHEPFIHPIICGIILHFMLSYEHPFVDGNGRTARALFYWYMAKAQYWLIEYLSISKTIKKAPIKYTKSFLFVEHDKSDLTYFLDYQTDVILESILDLFKYLAHKTTEFKRTELILRGELQKMLNHRQIAVITHAMQHPGFTYSIQSHARSHSVAYQTARTDLLKLDELKLLKKFKRGKAYLFESPANLNEKVENYKNQ